MAQLLTVKNKQIISRSALKPQHPLTPQENTAFVIEQQAGQLLPQIRVEQDKTLITLNEQESLLFDTWQTPELYLQTPEQHYKLVYGQWATTESFPLEITPVPQGINESVTLAQGSDSAQLGGLIGSTESTGNGWLWGGIGVLTLGGLGLALSNSGGSGKGSDSGSDNRPKVTVKGEADVGNILTAEVDHADNAANKVTYQWYADGKPIVGANADTYQVTEADKGKTITVEATLTDNTGKQETVKSQDNPANNNNSNPSTETPPPKSDGKLGVYVPKPVTDFVANVKDYGAKGDGKTDDTAAIQKAINEVAAKGGGIVDIPAGTYLINGSTYKGTHGIVSDDGGNGLMLKSNVILRMTDNTALKVIPNGEKGYSIITLYNVKNAHVLGGTLIGDRDEHQDMLGTWGNGINVISSQNVVLEKVTAKDFWGLGFYINKNSSQDVQSENITLYNVTALNNRRQGISINDGKGIKIIDSEFSATNGHMPQSGINIEPNISNRGSVSDVEIIGNTFKNNQGFAVSLSNSQYTGTTLSNVRVANNLMEHNRDGIWALGVKGGSITGNTIYNLDITGGRTGGERQIRLDSNSENITVADNTFYGGSAIKNSGTNNIISNNIYKSSIFIRGQAKAGETLTAKVYDGDGVGKDVRYEWRLDGRPIDGQTGEAYTVKGNDSGKRISVQAIFTDEKGNLEQAISMESAPVGSSPPNNPPNYLTLSPERMKGVSYLPIVPENRAGYVIGKLTVDDPDVGDIHSFRVKDPRFEITTDGYLKLKDGQALYYFENNHTINLPIEVTDRAGAKFVYYGITVHIENNPAYTHPNSAPTDITLSNTTVPLNKAGASIGRLQVVDSDTGDNHTFIISDGRFEIVNGELRLKPGQMLTGKPYGFGLSITAIDQNKAEYKETFRIDVVDDTATPSSNRKTLGLPMEVSAKIKASDLLDLNDSVVKTTSGGQAGLQEPTQYNAPIYKEDESLTPPIAIM